MEWFRTSEESVVHTSLHTLDAYLYEDITKSGNYKRDRCSSLVIKLWICLGILYSRWIGGVGMLRVIETQGGVLKGSNKLTNVKVVGGERL